MKWLEAKGMKRDKNSVANKMIGGDVEDKGTDSGDDAWDESDEQADITPNALELAKELGVRPSKIRGSGEKGRITVGDVRKAAERAE